MTTNNTGDMEEKKYNIVITTGIYPPEIGGPSIYAKALFSECIRFGHIASVVTYGKIKQFPTGVRHLIYFLRLLPKIVGADVLIALDTYSVALPTVIAGMLFRKKVLIRVGGDFLWEQYIERTKESILLSEFYTLPRQYTKKEQIIFDLTKFIFTHADRIIFTTSWQRDIMQGPYAIDTSKIFLIENEYRNEQKRNIVPKQKIILSPSRDIFLKNKKNLYSAFEILKKRFFDISLDTTISSHADLIGRIRDCYCVIVPSLSEVSPNIVLEALSLGVPVVVTEDCGIRDRIGDIAVWVDPKNPQSIADGVEGLLDAVKYSDYMVRMSKFDFVHTRSEIAEEYIKIISHL